MQRRSSGGEGYRLGMIFDGQRLIFERVLHRQEIYRYFPK